ncbi:hypothetical protein EI94DRAFT_1700094 [Lactarius quietus]|nr:hypothetical protein EI94DRAFT_1700094 [Lactarius quietus]
MPSEDARPELEVWLAALDQMSLLRTLTLHSLPQLLLHFYLTSSAPSHFLSLYTWISRPLLWIERAQTSSVCRATCPWNPRHPASAERAHPQLCNDLGILVWPVPGIDAEVHDPPTFLGATLPTRVTLTFRSKDRDGSDAPPDPRHVGPATARATGPPADLGFIKMLLEGNGGSENPLLPSLTELVLVYAYLYQLPLCDALMKRVEQGVPLEMLDLRLCLPDLDNAAAVQLLSEIVIDVLGPEETFEAVEQIESMWDPLVARGPFIEETDPDTEDDDDH